MFLIIYLDEFIQNFTGTKWNGYGQAQLCNYPSTDTDAWPLERIILVIAGGRPTQ